MATKKKLPTDVVYVLVPTSQITTYYSLKDAQERAKDDLVFDDSDSFRILAVTKSWVVEIPEQPEPIIDEESLDDLEAIT